MEEKTNKVTITKGMANAQKNVSRQCNACGLKVPVYPGRYSADCSDCGGPLSTPSAKEQIEMVRQGADPHDIAKGVWGVEEGIASDISDFNSKGKKKKDDDEDKKGAAQGAKGKKKKDDDEDKKKKGGKK